MRGLPLRFGHLLCFLTVCVNFVWARVDHVCEPAICSVAMRRFFVLNDLYVENDVRAGGIGRALMQRAHEHARECGAVRVDLETAIDNIVGQSLYESIGYVRDSKFYMYSLDVSKPA